MSKRQQQTLSRRQKLVTAKREQDGKFALLLETEDAVQRDLRREALRRQRMEQLNADPANADLLASGINPSDVFA
jgi:hypothetical protein